MNSPCRQHIWPFPPCHSGQNSAARSTKAYCWVCIWHCNTRGLKLWHDSLLWGFGTMSEQTQVKASLLFYSNWTVSCDQHLFYHYKNNFKICRICFGKARIINTWICCFVQVLAQVITKTFFFCIFIYLMILLTDIATTTN